MKNYFAILLPLFGLVAVTVFYLTGRSGSNAVSKVVIPISKGVEELHVLDKTQKKSRTPAISTIAEANKKNNIRSDVLRKIENLYSKDPLKKRHAYLIAENYQKILDEPTNYDEIQQMISKEVACRTLRFDAKDAVELGRTLEAITFNNDLRVDAYIEWNAFWDGRVIRPYPLEESACTG